MFEDARSIWPDFSTSPQQMDPVVHMMFKAMASSLKNINDKVNNVSDIIINDLACRIFFDGLLHPIPSSTILKFSTGSSQTTVDMLTEACWVNTSIQPSTTFYFSPVEAKELYPIEAAFALSISGDGINILWTNPTWEGRGEFLGHFGTVSPVADSIEKDYLYIGLKSSGQDNDVPRTDLFIDASSGLLEYLRWSRWRFARADGLFAQPVIPGLERMNKIWSKQAEARLSLWGHNYYPHEHKGEYQNSFFDIKPGSVGKAPLELMNILPDAGGELLNNLGPLYWIQIESDKKIPADELKSFELAATNCAVAINTHHLKQSYFYHGPGPMEIELQDKAGEIYEIVTMDDNHGRVYSNIYTASGDGKNHYYYVPRIEDSRFKLIVSPPKSEAVPDRFLLEYRISAGEAANNISAGLIDSLYNPHPGIDSVINLTTTRGGTSARSYNDMIKAFPNVLRSYNRAVIPSDYESLALSFDRRIVSAKARPGSVERDGVLRGCIQLEVDLGGHKFKLAEEESLFLARLSRFLELRSPVGTLVAAKFAG